MTITRTSFVLAVPNLARASAYWCEVLGFASELRPEGWDFVGRDGCRVMLGECPDDLPPSALGSHNYFGYFVLDDLDGYHAEIAARGALIKMPPKDRPWGIREMIVETPDGHRMVFAQQA